MSLGVTCGGGLHVGVEGVGFGVKTCERVSRVGGGRQVTRDVSPRSCCSGRTCCALRSATTRSSAHSSILSTPGAMGFGARMGTMGATRWSAKCCGYTAERANKGGERPEAIIEPAIAKTARRGSREALDARKCNWNCVKTDVARRSLAYRMQTRKPGARPEAPTFLEQLRTCT